MPKCLEDKLPFFFFYCEIKLCLEESVSGVCSIDDQKCVNAEFQADVDDVTQESFNWK